MRVYFHYRPAPLKTHVFPRSCLFVYILVYFEGRVYIVVSFSIVLVSIRVYSCLFVIFCSFVLARVYFVFVPTNECNGLVVEK